MKAIVKTRAEPGLWMEDVPEPEIGINDVLIKVEKTAICGTDVHIHDWDPWAQKTLRVPLVIGHEFVGIVEEVGSNVRDFQRGIFRRRCLPGSHSSTLCARRLGGLVTVQWFVAS